jgi:hypothetical protein
MLDWDRRTAKTRWHARLMAGVLLAVALLLNGCAGLPRPTASTERKFDFSRDTFAYANELVWEYHFDDQGHWHGTKREPPPEYSLHCFVVARSAEQFFLNARFDPSLPTATETEYRKLISRVANSSPRHSLPPEKKIVIPAYASLREFSQAREKLLKEECGGAWQSYLQRGNWRMVFPFSRGQQESEATCLAAALLNGDPVVVHLVRFPDLSINHAVLLYGVRYTDHGWEFATYDPNVPAKPTTLDYDREKRCFTFPANTYFHGGELQVYQIYNGWFY